SVREYAGRTMSLDLNGDITAFFQPIARISGFELDIAPSIKRTVAVHFENIPWDLALDAVLRTSGLGSELDRNVLHITIANPAFGQERVLMGTVTIVGTIAEVNVQNPSAYLRIDGPNRDGKMQTWTVEWESADYLKVVGISPSTLK